MPSRCSLGKRFGDFYGGLLHPLTSLELGLGFLGVALVVGQQGKQGARWMLGWFFGALGACAVAVACLPIIEAEIRVGGLLATAVLGILAATAPRFLHESVVGSSSALEYRRIRISCESAFSGPGVRLAVLAHRCCAPYTRMYQSIRHIGGGQLVKSRAALLAAGLVLFSASLLGPGSSWCTESSESVAEVSGPVVVEGTDDDGSGPETADTAGETPTPGQEKETLSSKAETEAIQPDTLVELLVTPWMGDLDGMLRVRTIRALVVPSRTMYFVDRAKRHGIAYELLTAFETAINKRHPPKRKHLETHVAFIPVARDRLIPSLLEGLGDIVVADITITDERRKLIDFSDPFFRDINEIVVTGPAAPELGSLDDVSGQEVFVRPSSSYREHLEQLNKRLAEDEKRPVRLKPAPEQLEDEDLLEMVDAGLLDIIVVDDYKATLWASVFPNIRLHHDIQVNADGEFAWMIRKDSPKLMEAINAFAKTHGQGSSFGDTLVLRYVDSTKFVQRATSPQALERFENVIALFRRYSDQYDVNYLLMLAKGYQESRLNQKARSRVGAIGIMQLMPATGKQMRVGNIHKLEPNIHAGIKYHRWVMDHYFEDEPMDDLDKTLFTFAAYNAGPGRVRGLRRAAEKRGLDPDVWFDNVELLAAEKIGSETVNYVANIFKYYVAYKLVEEQKQRRRAAAKALQPQN